MLRRAPEALCPWSCRSSCAPPVHSGYMVSVASPSSLSFAPLATDAIAAVDAQLWACAALSMFLVTMSITLAPSSRWIVS